MSQKLEVGWKIIWVIFTLLRYNILKLCINPFCILKYSSTTSFPHKKSWWFSWEWVLSLTLHLAAFSLFSPPPTSLVTELPFYHECQCIEIKDTYSPISLTSRCVNVTGFWYVRSCVGLYGSLLKGTDSAGSYTILLSSLCSSFQLSGMQSWFLELQQLLWILK